MVRIKYTMEKQINIINVIVKLRLERFDIVCNSIDDFFQQKSLVEI